MNILYKPKGPAKEYADDPIMRTEGWAANLYHGCLHGCEYCYVPDIRFWRCKGEQRRELFHASTSPRKDVLHKLELDLKKCKGMPEPVFLSFTSDIYQPFENSEQDITRDALLLFEKYDINVTILTKGGMRAVRDFDIMVRNRWKFGVTIAGVSSSGYTTSREPNAAAEKFRMDSIKKAHSMGIYTWVSMEPVLFPEYALQYIDQLQEYVDFWKVGKLNHGKALGPAYEDMEAYTDWADFLSRVEARIPRERLLIKHDLEACRELAE